MKLNHHRLKGRPARLNKRKKEEIRAGVAQLIERPNEKPDAILTPVRVPGAAIFFNFIILSLLPSTCTHARSYSPRVQSHASTLFCAYVKNSKHWQHTHKRQKKKKKRKKEKERKEREKERLIELIEKKERERKKREKERLIELIILLHKDKGLGTNACHSACPWNSCTHTHTHTHTHTYIYIHTHTHTYIYIYRYIDR